MSDTPRTDAVRHNVAELAMHARKLERELADYNKVAPERLKEAMEDHFSNNLVRGLVSRFKEAQREEFKSAFYR